MSAFGTFLYRTRDDKTCFEIKTHGDRSPCVFYQLSLIIIIVLPELFKTIVFL